MVYVDKALAQILIQVCPLPDTDAEELAELAAQLRSLLLRRDLDVEWVEFAEEGEPPPSAKAVDVITIGRLIVYVASPTPDSWPGVPALISVVQSWVLAHDVWSVRIKLDRGVANVMGTAFAEQNRLFGSSVARHADTPAVPAR